MHSDVSELQAFYARPLGITVRRLLGPRIRAHWHGLGGMTVIGLGYPIPFLGPLRGEAAAVGILMPRGQGVVPWPEHGPNLVALVEEDSVPLPDSSVDRLLAIHSVEVTDNPRKLVREIWRVLKPEGRLLLVVPNRRGPWARSDGTPFGQGRPYTRGQLERLLALHLLTPVSWSSALYLPPTERSLVLRYAAGIERSGAKAWPAFAGVLMVEAKKEVMALIGTAHAAARPARARPAHAAPGTSRTRAESLPVLAESDAKDRLRFHSLS